MKFLILLKVSGVIYFSLLVAGLFAQGVKIGQNPQNVHSSAVLQLEHPNKGLLISSVSLTNAVDNTTVPVPATGLLVYNTNTSGSGNDAVSPGFYYWDGSRWKGLLTSTGPSGDVWVDANNNILSVNSANQSLSGFYNVVLGYDAFADNFGPTNNVVAIGNSAARNNAGFEVNALGPESCEDNTGGVVNAMAGNRLKAMPVMM